MVFFDLSLFSIVFPFFCVYLMVWEVKLQKRCDKNRKRSKRRDICCPVHHCYIDSVSQKYPLFADQVEQLEKRGMPRQNALRLVSSRTTVPLEGEWVEAFWCEHCQQTSWYHVCKGADRTFQVLVASRDIWQYVTGVIAPDGNPSVGEFTRKNARMIKYNGVKDFHFVV